MEAVTTLRTTSAERIYTLTLSQAELSRIVAFLKDFRVTAMVIPGWH
jgi:hypothetical protein